MSAGVCYFSYFSTLCYSIYVIYVYKLIGWDPENIYLFKFISRNTKKRYGTCQKFTINAVESHSSALLLTLNIFYTFFSAFIVDFEHVNVFIEQVKDEQMLYLKSFKIAADLLNS